MYKLTGFTPGVQAESDADAIREEFGRILRLANHVRPLHPLFLRFGTMDKDAAARGRAIMDRLALQDEPSEDELAELDNLSASPNTRFLFDDPDGFLDNMTEAHRKKISDDPATPISISVRTDGPYEGKIQRTVYRTRRNFGSFALQMPMQDKTDFWYQDWRTMRDIMFAAMEIWTFDWIVAQPTMYTGLQKNLFPDRRSFGWMGWTPDILTDEPNDALAMVAPYNGGTFMLLQERMMNMKKPDIEACNKAEAYLLDRGILDVL